ncbi:hypothetical protein V7O67_09645 [Methanolobus sp. ZRKC4]|uniref:hypothetical protein n=1 Tax=Methanolobus sp. ZRKC4 TaxID=3125787 RepID=UPI003254ADA8
MTGQTFSLIDYDLTVSLGLQESAEEVGEVGVSWAKGVAFADTIEDFEKLPSIPIQFNKI